MPWTCDAQMLHLRARPWAPAMHHQQQRCPAASASPCTSGRRVPPLDQRLSLFASRRRAHSPPSATETTGPVSVQDAAERVAALKEQREKALKQLREVDAALRDEMFRERANGANASSNGGGHGDKAAHAVASTGWGVSELDNFGYIRQFSGEPYDLTKASLCTVRGGGGGGRCLAGVRGCGQASKQAVAPACPVCKQLHAGGM